MSFVCSALLDGAVIKKFFVVDKNPGVIPTRSMSGDDADVYEGGCGVVQPVSS